MLCNKLSNSKDNVWKDCPYKYGLQYEEHLKGDLKDASPTQFGSFIHKVFELALTSSSYDEVAEIATKVRSKYRFKAEYDRKTSTAINNWLRFKKPLLETCEIIGEELDEKVMLPGCGTLYHLIVDLVLRGEDGGILIIDYKTGKREQSKMDLMRDDQLMGYVWGVSKLYDLPLQRITAAHYYPLTDHFVQVHYSDGQIFQFVQRKKKSIKQIRETSGDHLAPRRNQFCNWCQFKTACPAFNDSLACAKKITELRERRDRSEEKRAAKLANEKDNASKDDNN